MHKVFPLPVIEFLLPEEVPTASEESSHCKYKTAQELWAAILKTFGGNEATKKTKKNLLKQQYGNFKAEGSETFEQTFNRLQVIISQLQFMDVEIEQDDLNQKFLTSLAPEWLMHMIVWRNRSDLDTMSLDDLYNHPKIDEDDIEEMDIKWNMALLSMRADRSQDRGRRDNYRQGSKVEEHAPKALMAIDGVGWDWSYMANDEENHALVADEEAPTEFALMAKTSVESEVFDSSLCSKAYKKNTDSLNSTITELTDKLFDAKNMIYHYKLALAQVETRLAELRNQELKYCKKIRVLEFKTESSTDCIENLKKELELIKKENEGLDTKLTGFQTTSKDLDSLLESQRLDKKKEGLGYCVAPPPPAQIYSPPKKDMSWTGLSECADDTITDYSRLAPTIERFLDDAQNRNPSVTETEASPSTISPKHFIKFVKANDSQTKSKTNKVETAKKPPIKYAEQYRKPTKKPNGSSQNNIDDKSYWDSRCSRHMTGNISYLSNYEPFDGGYVSFGQGGCKITGKGTIKTDKLEFENVYFLKDLNISHKWYCVVVTDDFSRFTWTFFLKTKDETSGILRKFITEIENLKDLKVKIIRCDNGREFRNKEMNDFCLQKGTKREFSNVRTPQHNGVAERRNMTLIEAARTMLADAKLLVTFWAEAVNTACYVQNRVLVNKSQNKTPYELFNGRTPAIGFLKPFC
nr:putative ribonuclease H-like domain-containing protein [Tanacetum cinerariifolium]